MGEHVQEELVALLDGELPEAERSRVEGHLVVCPDCRARRELLQGALASLSKAAPLEPSADLRRRVLAAVDAEPRGLMERFRALLSTRFLVPAAAGLAAALFLVVSVGREQPVGAGEELEVAERLDLFEDYDVVATALPMDIPASDMDVVVHLHELQVGD
jgi:anti-sigma factor RsiW